MRQLGALIRSHFGVDPYTLDEASFAALAAEALYLEEYRARYWRAVRVEGQL